MASENSEEKTPWFLSGNYAPVQDELTDTGLRVTGSIPAELSGLYVRNTPNPVNGQGGHWFFGDGMVHGVRIEDGNALWYRNRWVKTTKLAGGLDAMDPKVMMDRTASSANTHVIGHAGKILALEEGNFQYELTRDLDTVGCLDYGGKLTTESSRPLSPPIRSCAPKRMSCISSATGSCLHISPTTCSTATANSCTARRSKSRVRQ